MSFAFGGPAWPISAVDLNFGAIGNNASGQCLGAIFDFTQHTGIEPSPGEPVWVFGDTFLVGFFASLVLKPGFS
jgi:cathepsin D